MAYNVFSGKLNPAQSVNQSINYNVSQKAHGLTSYNLAKT